MDLLTWLRNQWDRVSAWVLIAAGAVALVVGWLGVSRSPLTVEQMAYVVSGGIGAMFLLGLGAMLWLSADLRDEWRVLDEIRRNQLALLEHTQGSIDLAGEGGAAEAIPETSEGNAPGRRSSRPATVAHP